MKNFSLFLIAAISMLLTSCYDSKEVDNMVYVLAIGVDSEESGEDSYTFQFALPLNISKGSSGDEEPLHCETVRATNIYSAMDYFNKLISKEITLSHLKLIVFSEDIALSGLEKYKTSFLNDTEILPSACVVISQGSAKDYLNNVFSPLELNPSRYYNFAFDEKNSPFSEAFYLKNFFETGDFTIPLVYADSEKAETRGAVMFKNNKTCTMLSSEEIPFLKLLSGTLNKTTLDFTAKGFSVTVTQQRKPFIKVEKDNLNVYITLYISREIQGTAPKNADELIEEKIRLKCLNIIKKAQAQNSDILKIKAAFRPHFLTVDDFNNFNFEEKYKDIYFDIKFK